ncbi:CIR protein [Plasmodium chabaudi chabaudi]|uniref:CIR protein n=1 Tax=Plasmodium chabaudi chabaudi TaxID=31271 RepID=A0A4V0K420_PLACU|nr:CIR protein [Plasmodium chabaudi chabaudi]VTZ67597.1 CIR protein [Plasmodium chabaudi chabaudi]|eukprot:XP_016653362.1 CIR protein [Plasmodium chabaudi chabaudi]
MSKEVCKAFKDIDKLIKVESSGEDVFIENNKILNAYCPTYVNGEGGQCIGYIEIVNSGFISLLEKFNNFDNGRNLESERRFQYAILWLGYKLNKYSNIKLTILNDFYTKIKINSKYIMHITGNETYKNYKDHIDKKPDLMNMNIKTIFKFYEALQILCNMHNEDKEKNTDCTKCSQDAEKFVESFKELNDDSNHIEGSSYSQILSTLSNDYDNFKKTCCNGQSKNLPSLPQIKPTKISSQKSLEGSGKGSAQKSLESPGHTYGQNSEDISLKSPIANTLIPVLSIFAVPIFLGIAYKYSLFGFDKRLHRKYLREKVKQIKNKINHYI